MIVYWWCMNHALWCAWWFYLQHRNHANGGSGVHGGFTCSIAITQMVVVVYWWCMNMPA
jgi:coproporphyrinogen III oxidase